MALALVWFLDNFTDQDWKKKSLIIDIPPLKYCRSCEKILNDDKGSLQNKFSVKVGNLAQPA